MKEFEEEFNYLIELSGKVLIGQIDAKEFEKHRADFINEYGKKQQSELTEVPPFVADWLDSKPLYAINGSISVEVIKWSQKQTGYADLGMNISHLLKLKVNGYTVKEKRFYLKNKLTGLYLRSYTGMSMDDTTLRFEEVSDNRACGFGGGTQFTQQEIDSMETGSYEQIEVEE
jgi:hypothetical protein